MHEGAIRTLAVQRNEILLSVDEEHINVVRVWRKQSWCDLEDVLGRNAAKIAAGRHFPKLGLEIFSSLPRPSTSTSILSKILTAGGGSLGDNILHLKCGR